MDQNINIFPEKGGDTSLRITILDEKKTDRQVMQTLVLLTPHSNSKQSTSIMFCGNANGDYLAPMVVYKANNIYQGWIEA